MLIVATFIVSRKKKLSVTDQNWSTRDHNSKVASGVLFEVGAPRVEIIYMAARGHTMGPTPGSVWSFAGEHTFARPLRLEHSFSYQRRGLQRYWPRTCSSKLYLMLVRCTGSLQDTKDKCSFLLTFWLHLKEFASSPSLANLRCCLQFYRKNDECWVDLEKGAWKRSNVHTEESDAFADSVI